MVGNKSQLIDFVFVSLCTGTKVPGSGASYRFLFVLIQEKVPCLLNKAMRLTELVNLTLILKVCGIYSYPDAAGLLPPD